jgi:2',3'-cyclic-nucleotide 2'-phosphodiesterase (5'-nucleotidase family)
MMGTLFHTLAREEGVELRLLHALGYDVVTLGNHEFDFRPDGLARMVQAAIQKGGVPPLLLANAVFSETDTRDDELHELFKKGIVKEYRVIKIDDAIPADPAVQAEVERYEQIIDRNVLSQYGLTFDRVLAETSFDLRVVANNSNLGNLVSDAIRWGIDRYQYDPQRPQTRTVIAVESNGMIREDILKRRSGLLQSSDLFRVVPLGIGMVEDTPGYPLVSFYLTAPEIKRALEVLPSLYIRSRARVIIFSLRV